MWDLRTLRELNATATALFDPKWRKFDGSPNRKETKRRNPLGPRRLVRKSQSVNSKTRIS